MRKGSRQVPYFFSQKKEKYLLYASTSRYPKTRQISTETMVNENNEVFFPLFNAEYRELSFFFNTDYRVLSTEYGVKSMKYKVTRHNFSDVRIPAPDKNVLTTAGYILVRTYELLLCMVTTTTNYFVIHTQLFPSTSSLLLLKVDSEFFFFSRNPFLSHRKG